VSGYAAPLSEMRFALDAISELGEIAALPGYEAAAAAETVDAILEEAAKFAGEVLAPLNTIGDRERSRLENGLIRTPTGFKAAYEAFVAGGWNALAMPAEHGGQGLPLSLGIAVLEMWTSANLAFSLCPILTQAAVELLAAHGSDTQRRLYLGKLMSGEWAGTMNLTEPQAGSDLGAVRMRAVKDGGHYRLTGQKIFITYGDHDLAPNIIHAVLARTPNSLPGSKGLSLFIVPKFLVNDDGSLGARNDIRCLKLEEKLGIHASPTCVLSYGDSGGAVGTLIGEEGRGIEYMFLMMNGARLNVGLQGVAIAERAYQHARAYASDRVQGRPITAQGSNALPIIHHPDVRRMLLAIRSDAEAARALLYYTAGQIDRARRASDEEKRTLHQVRADLLIPIAKAWSTARGFEAASTNIQVHGGMGFVEETGAAQYLRDARISLIYEGTNGIQANDLLTRKLARDDGTALREFIAEMRTLDLTDLAALAKPLHDGIGALEQASDTLRGLYRSQPAIALGGAMAFLELFGTVSAGWLMAKAAAAASRERDAEFAAAKRVTAQFFGEQRLAAAPALLAAIAGGATVMQLDPDRI
jgi:alkylation response protein AidB-like acyl-CoA dehydrogenase